MDRLEAMGVFIRVAETQNFTKAGSSLGLPKASVSSTVSRLEERLGVRLFTRTTRRVELTADGALFYERCKDLLADAEEVETLFQESDRDLSGRIRVDMPSRMARFRVIPGLGEFFARYPKLMIELGASERTVDIIREGYDCVVRVGELADSPYITRRIGELSLMNCASPAYLEAHGTPRCLEDLKGHFMVHFAGIFGSRPDGFEYEDNGVWKELPMHGRLSVSSADAYVAACVAGLGIIQVPRSTLDEELRAGRLVEFLPELSARPMPVHILFPPGRRLPRRVRVFSDWLLARLTADPGP